jgi:DNA repair exonuclease SbcCD ATPase subunit
VETALRDLEKQRQQFIKEREGELDTIENLSASVKDLKGKVKKLDFDLTINRKALKEARTRNRELEYTLEDVSGPLKDQVGGRASRRA